MEKEAQRERKTDSAPKVAEKGGWIAHRESVRKKDGQDTGMMGKGEERRTKETRRRKEFEGVGCRHRRGRCRFLPRCRRRRRLSPPRPPPPSPPLLSPPPPPQRCRFFPLAGRQARSFFLLFPIIDKTETAQYRDTAPRRGVGKRSLSTTLFS